MAIMVAPRKEEDLKDAKNRKECNRFQSKGVKKEETLDSKRWVVGFFARGLQSKILFISFYLQISTASLKQWVPLKHVQPHVFFTVTVHPSAFHTLVALPPDFNNVYFQRQYLFWQKHSPCAETTQNKSLSHSC